MADEPKIVMVCPTMERLDLLQGLVKSVKQVMPEGQPLVVVASGEDDGTKDWCEFQGIEVLNSPTRLPFGAAVNLAASHVLKEKECDWLLLVNNDVILQPEFYSALLQMIGYGYEIIGSKLLYPDGKIQHYGKIFTLDFFPFHVLRYQEKLHPDSLQVRPFPDVTFACVAIKRVIWEALNGLDESFVNGFEDDDFCLRARLQGAQIGVHPLMLATHLESRTSGLDTENKAQQYLKFKKKWIDSGLIQWSLGMFQGWRNA